VEVNSIIHSIPYLSRNIPAVFQIEEIGRLASKYDLIPDVLAISHPVCVIVI